MDEKTADAIRFAALVVPVLRECDGWVYSWGRSDERNRDVGGHPESRHIDFCAIDAGFYSRATRDLAYSKCYSLGLHGYKKEFTDQQSGKKVYAFHMQDRPGRREVIKT